MRKISLLSLGCPKNTVDSEKLLHGLARRGVQSIDDPEKADVIAVNTCGFIEDARRESIEEILKLSGYKRNGKELLVIGCLAQRYREELLSEIPEIDAIFGVGQEEAIIRHVAGENMPAPSLHEPPRLADGPYRYVKVSEGCSRRCTFCVIPSIRGPHRSRAPEDVLADAREAIDSGTKELILIAQDITAYSDRRNKGYGLPDLLEDISAIDGDFWIRLLYLHPAGIDDKLLEIIARQDKIVKYIDMPLQHSEDRVLRSMGRAGGTRKQYLRLIDRVRRALPGVALRTSLIVGFPGESEEDFQGLLDFLEQAAFDRLGAFTYSREERTPAAALKNHVPDEIKQQRLDELMTSQAEISLEKNRALVGRTFRALVDSVGEDGYEARIYSQAPEIDGITILRGSNIPEGDFIDVRITHATHYDLDANTA